MNRVILFGAVIFLAFAVCANAELTLTYNQTQNTASQSVWNETFASADNKTFYVKFPKNSTVTDAKLNLSGYGYGNASDVLLSETIPSWTGVASIQTWQYNNNTIFLSTVTICSDDTPANYNQMNISIRSDNAYIGPISKSVNISQCTNVGTCGANSILFNCTINYWINNLQYLSVVGVNYYNSTFPTYTVNNSWINPQPYGYFGGITNIYAGELISQNPYLTVAGTQAWSYSGNFNVTDNQTSDFSSSINSYLRTCAPYTDGTCDVPFVLYSDSAGVIEVKLNATVTYDTQTYDSSVYEGTTSNFWIKVNSTADVTDVNATLIWNNTEYASTSKTHTGTFWTFMEALVIPTLTEDATIDFYWNFTYSNATDAYQQNFTINNQTVQTLVLTDNCTENKTLVFELLYEEDQDDPETFNYDININYGPALDNLYKNLNNSGRSAGNPLYICLNPITQTVYADAVIKYWGVYGIRYYYLDGVMLNNSTMNITIYLPGDIGADTNGYSDTTLTVKNQYSQIVTNALIEIQRMYGGTYETIAEGKTTGTGEFSFFLNSNIIYRIIITSTEGTKNTTFQPIESTYTFYVLPSDANIPSYWTYWKQVSGDCVYTNDTRLLRCEWLDTSAHLQSVLLTVMKRNATHTVTWCSNSSAAASGVILCNFGAPINNTFEWNFKGQFSSIPTGLLFSSGSWTDALVVTFGIMGLFLTFLIVMTCGFVGISVQNPVLTVIMTVLGVGVSMLLGLIDFVGSMQIMFVGFAISGGILIFKLK